MTSLAAYSKRPYVSFTERMREQALLRQQMQNEAEQRAYTQQKNALDLAQAEENLRQAQSGFGQGIPASVQQWNFYKNIRDPKEKELYLSTIKNSGGGYAQVNLGDQIGLLNKSTGQIEQTFPKGVLPRNYVNSLGDVSTIPGIPSGSLQGQGMMQSQPQQRYDLNLDSQLNAMASQGQPTQEFAPQIPQEQPTISQPVRRSDGTYEYNGRVYRNSKLANSAYDFDLKKQSQLDVFKGKERFKIELDLPTIESNANLMLNSIANLENNPGLDAIVGNPFSISKISKGGFGSLGSIPGTPAANAASQREQILGQTFLEAYERLKGGGAIATAEGAKGEQAIANLKTTQDPQEFRQSLAVLRDVVKNGLVVARQKAGVSQDVQGIAPATGVARRVRYNPNTGEFE